MQTISGTEAVQRMRLCSKGKTVRPLSGYAELRAELEAIPTDRVISDFDAYVCSANEEYVSAKVKSSKELVLFVEYGALSITSNAKGIRSAETEFALAAILHRIYSGVAPAKAAQTPLFFPEKSGLLHNLTGNRLMGFWEMVNMVNTLLSTNNVLLHSKLSRMSIFV
jgi:hypothetical protein